jgi:hypothetical protein
MEDQGITAMTSNMKVETKMMIVWSKMISSVKVRSVVNPIITILHNNRDQSKLLQLILVRFENLKTIIKMINLNPKRVMIPHIISLLVKSLQS